MTVILAMVIIMMTHVSTYIIYSKCDYQIFNYDGNGDYEGDDDDVDDNDVSPVLLFPQVDS